MERYLAPDYEEADHEPTDEEAPEEEEDTAPDKFEGVRYEHGWADYYRYDDAASDYDPYGAE